MVYYKHFDFKIQNIIDESILYKINPDRTHFNISILDINKNFIQLIESKGLMIIFIEVFKLDPLHRQWPIHVDGAHIGDRVKLNFVFGNKDSPMVWYKIKKQTVKETKFTAVGSKYLYWNIEELEEVDRTFIQNGTLVQVGQPHTAYLNGYSPRWVLGIHFIKNFKFLTFNELAEIFKEYEC